MNPAGLPHELLHAGYSWRMTEVAAIDWYSRPRAVLGFQTVDEESEK